MSARISLLAMVLFVMLAAPVLAEPGKGGGWQRIQQELGLTDSQMLKVKPIMEAYRSVRRTRIDALSARISELLTPQQRARFDEMRAGHGTSSSKSRGLTRYITELSLSPDQINKLKDLVNDSLQRARADRERFLDQIKGVLTPEQFSRLQEMIRRRKGDGG